MDGVVMNFTSAARQQVMELFHREVPEFTTTWAFTEGNWRLSKEEDAKLWETIGNSVDWFYAQEGPLPDAVRNLYGLTQLHTCYFITTRPQTLGRTTEVQTAWQLDDLGVRWPQVIVTKDKGPIARDLKLDAFIDDKWENCRDVSIASPNTKIFIRQWEYNKELPLLDGWTPVASLAEFAEKIKEL